MGVMDFGNFNFKFQVGVNGIKKCVLTYEFRLTFHIFENFSELKNSYFDMENKIQQI